MRGAEEIFSRRVYEQRGPRGLPAIGYPHWKSTVSEDTRQHGCCSAEVQYTHSNNAIEYDRFIARESYTLGLSPARPTARTKSVHPFTFLSTLHSETCKHRVCRYFPLAQFFFFFFIFLLTHLTPRHFFLQALSLAPALFLTSQFTQYQTDPVLSLLLHCCLTFLDDTHVGFC